MSFMDLMKSLKSGPLHCLPLSVHDKAIGTVYAIVLIANMCLMVFVLQHS